MAKMAANMSDVVGGMVLSRWREGTWMGMKTRGYVGQRNKLGWEKEQRRIFLDGNMFVFLLTGGQVMCFLWRMGKYSSMRE